MKKVGLFLSFILCINFIQAQEFKKFKTDLGILVAIPGSDLGTGGGLYLEPKYNITDQISVGLRLEGVLLANVDIEEESGSISLISSSLLTGDYYFTNEKFRPWAGLGLGFYNVRSINSDDEDINLEAERSFGFAPRIGFTYGHFRLGLAYNFVGERVTTVSREVFGIVTTVPANVSFNYFSIKLGFEIGGGRIND